MPETAYRIDADPQRERLHIEIVGIWNEAAAVRFAIDLKAAHAAMALGGAGPGRFLAVLDLREQEALSDAVIASFGAFAAGPGGAARRAAVLVRSTLQTMQLRRIAGPLGRWQFFLLESEAEAWLEDATEIA